MRTLRLIVMSVLLTGCGLCSTHVYVGTVKLSTDNQVCLSISPDDFNKKSTFKVIGWNIYSRDEKGHLIKVAGREPYLTTEPLSDNNDVIISPGECIYSGSNILPGSYEFDFSTTEENDLNDIYGREVWQGTFTLSQDANGQLHLTDKKGRYYFHDKSTQS
ncbi:hypothetical protein XT96_000547 [Salmonella enterica subsp. enterica serovar Havana]|nr:hypothetical protein [Salmonella enterica subsp. enterica serovar Havana]EHA8895363.1 hypothetical protein [Salmonella enterica subsp. enterica]EHH4742668.1 hypothetical protein [Salmonella enterica subsp. enterica]